MEVHDTSNLFTTLMRLMLEEVWTFTNPHLLGPWSKSVRIQVCVHSHFILLSKALSLDYTYLFTH